jgi:hypothetical protein
MLGRDTQIARRPKWKNKRCLCPTLPCTSNLFSIDLVETSTRHTGTLAARLRWVRHFSTPNKIGQAGFARAIGEYGSVIFG